MSIWILTIQCLQVSHVSKHGRSIIDKMVYNDISHIVDSNISCSNIGARKKRNIRDHLFVINGIIYDQNFRGPGGLLEILAPAGGLLTLLTILWLRHTHKHTNTHTQNTVMAHCKVNSPEDLKNGEFFQTPPQNRTKMFF